MSWSSLFAFSNPTGEVGKTYSAANVIITATVGGTANATPVQNLAIFTGLPIGIYSVSISIPLSNASGTATALDYWNVGASILGATSSTFGLGSTTIIPFPTTIAAENASPILVKDFILNNTSGAATIYINSSFVNGGTNNAQLAWNATTLAGVGTSSIIVATKLA
jgi:hypothetical protein